MKKIFSIFLIALSLAMNAQVGIGTDTPDVSSILDVVSTSKGVLVPRMTTAQRDAIVTPAKGLMIYNITLNCLNVNDGTPTAPIWRCATGTAGNDGSQPSSNGTAIVSAYGGAGCTGSGTINGSMTQGVAVSGVTMTLYADVTQVGSWTLSAVNNGVTFSGSGTFTTLGCQSITLTAAGTPTASGPFTWATNSIPAGSGAATVVAAFDPTGITPGAGSLSGRACFDIALSNDNTNSCAPLTARTATQANFTLPAIHTQTYTFTPSGTVSNVRFYYINDVGNAVIAITGGNAGNSISTAQTATVNYNTNNNTLALGLTNSNPMTTRIFAVYNINATNNNNPADDRVLALTANVKDCACCGAFVAAGVWKEFMCHNLGATTSLNPHVPVQGIHGNYYQWGRSTVVANASTPAGAIAGWNTTPAANGSWLDASKTANDPCPAGFRVPTKAQWDGVIANNTVSRTGSWASSNSNYTTAIHWGPNASTKLLTLPAAGYRYITDGTLNSRGNGGTYWSSSENGTSAGYMNFDSASAGTGSSSRTYGFSVRCVSE